MIFDVGAQLEFISNYITLDEGDLLLTGSPPGVEVVKNGDVIDATMSVDGKVLATINQTVKYLK